MSRRRRRSRGRRRRLIIGDKLTVSNTFYWTKGLFDYFIQENLVSSEKRMFKQTQNNHTKESFITPKNIYYIIIISKYLML